ncbi:MAG: PA2779 family protein, partial [Thioalkalispiraceae bacterium]
YLSAIVAGTVFWLSMQPVANASIIGTDDLVAEQQSVIERDTLLSALERDDVKQMLVQKGVDPENAKQRVASLTDEEVIALNEQLDDLPAGSGVVGAVVFVFLVLLVTDILGYTDVFPFVKKTHK